MFKKHCIITRKQPTQQQLPVNNILTNIIETLIDKKILCILNKIHNVYPTKFTKEHIQLEFNIIKQKIHIINKNAINKNAINKNALNNNTVNNNTVNTDNILKLLGNVQLLEQRCNARIWGFIYDKTTLKKIILLDKIYKVKYATKLKLKDFNNKYILGSRCMRNIDMPDNIYCIQHIQHLTHGNYNDIPDAELCLHFIKDGKYL